MSWTPKDILGLGRYQILLGGLTWIWRVWLTMWNSLCGKWKRNRPEKPSFLNWWDKLPPIASLVTARSSIAAQGRSRNCFICTGTELARHTAYPHSSQDTSEWALKLQPYQVFFLLDNHMFSCVPGFSCDNALTSAEWIVNAFGFETSTAEHYRHSYCYIYFVNTIWSHEVYCQQKQTNVNAFCQKNSLAALCQQTASYISSCRKGLGFPLSFMFPARFLY